MKVFHIDRLKLLSEGQTITLFDDYALDVPHGHEICSQVRTMYPQGISEHGNRYLFLAENDNWLYETILENARLLNHPKSQSRFQSFFAVSDVFLPQMMERLEATESNSYVFEIDACKYDVYDMNIINDMKYGGAGTTLYHANRYWAKERTSNPLLELLLPLPVTIGRRVFK